MKMMFGNGTHMIMLHILLPSIFSFFFVVLGQHWKTCQNRGRGRLKKQHHVFCPGSFIRVVSFFFFGVQFNFIGFCFANLVCSVEGTTYCIVDEAVISGLYS